MSRHDARRRGLIDVALGLLIFWVLIGLVVLVLVTP